MFPHLLLPLIIYEALFYFIFPILQISISFEYGLMFLRLIQFISECLPMDYRLQSRCQMYNHFSHSLFLAF